MNFESHMKSEIPTCISNGCILLTVEHKTELPSMGRFLQTAFKSNTIFQLHCALSHMKGCVLTPGTVPWPFSEAMKSIPSKQQQVIRTRPKINISFHLLLTSVSKVCGQNEFPLNRCTTAHYFSMKGKCKDARTGQWHC